MKSLSFRIVLLLACACAVQAQLSRSAYRVLGQPDLRQNGVNMVQGVELFAPSGVTVDTRDGPVYLYIADTRNSRVLAWRDARSYQMGDPPTLTLGQPGPQYSNPMGIGAKGFNAPLGLAVDPTTGNLYVADFGNNRVLRFPAPFANPTRVEPDAVYGQPDYNSRNPNPAGITKNSLNKPQAVACDSMGNLWVADTGNNRILRFPAAVLNSPIPPGADSVIGQKDFNSGDANRGTRVVSASGFEVPAGLVFDQQNNLYVSDFNNTRVLKFAAPLGPGNPDPAASTVFGEPNFTTRGVPPQASSASLAGPVGLAVDAAGTLYVAVPNDNRVMVFAPGAPSGGPATNVLGQSDFATTLANANVFPRASPNTLAGPSDVRVDPGGNVYVADTGNNRVLAFPPGSKSATRVWGQTDFAANGANGIKPGSINAPYKIAIDYSQTPFALYVSDRSNHRVLGWKDAVRFRNGDPADLVIGQPDFRTAIPNVDTRGSTTPARTSLAFPNGIVVDLAGYLYVADSGNNRVLRYPRPVNQSGRISPDVVLGQADFNSSVSAAVSAASLSAPAGLAIGPDGNVFVADRGNNRVLEFPASAGTRASAIRVYGQPNFTSSVAPSTVSAQTLASPQGVFVDASYNLYVADAGANRVLFFPNTQSAPPTGMAAAFVIGQDRFDSTGGGSGTNFRAPADVAIDSSGNIYVSDNGNNRVLVFTSLVFLPVSGATAAGVIGQRDLAGTAPNWNSSDGLATPEGLSAPLGLLVDRRDTLYVGDAGNNRVVHFLKPAVVVNAAHFQVSVPVAQAGLVTLFGAGLSEGSDSAAGVPWPFALVNREIVFNDVIKVPLLFVGPTQANFQVPSAAPIGSDRVAIRLSDTGELVAGGSVLVAASSPGLFTASQDGKGQGAILNQDKTLNGPSSPAPKGSVISLFGTGQGQVSPAVADGTPAPLDPLATTVAVPTSDGKTCLASQPSVCVAVGNSFGDIQFSGLAPGFVGLWQINVKIPQDVTAGNAVPVRAVINGTPSNIVTVAIR